MKKKLTPKRIWRKVSPILTIGSFVAGALLIILAFILEENMLLMGIGMGLCVLYFILTMINNAVFGERKPNPDYNPDGYNDGTDQRYLPEDDD